MDYGCITTVKQGYFDGFPGTCISSRVCWVTVNILHSQKATSYPSKVSTLCGARIQIFFEIVYMHVEEGYQRLDLCICTGDSIAILMFLYALLFVQIYRWQLDCFCALTMFHGTILLKHFRSQQDTICCNILALLEPLPSWCCVLVFIYITVIPIPD